MERKHLTPKRKHLSDEARRRLGPSHMLEVTEDLRATVRKLAECGVSQEDMCKLITNPETGKPIHRNTLTKHFSEELDTALIELRVKTASALIGALDDDKLKVSAAKWLEQSRFGYSEKRVNTIQDPNGEAPFKQQQNVVINIPTNGREWVPGNQQLELQAEEDK